MPRSKQLKVLSFPRLELMSFLIFYVEFENANLKWIIKNYSRSLDPRKSSNTSSNVSILVCFSETPPRECLLLIGEPFIVDRGSV